MTNKSQDGKTAYDIVKEYPHCPIKIPSGARSMTSAKIDFESVQDDIITWYEREITRDVGRHREWHFSSYGIPGRKFLPLPQRPSVFMSPQFPPLDHNDWPSATSYINAAQHIKIEEPTGIDMHEFKKNFKPGSLPGFRAMLEGAILGASISPEDSTKEYDFYFSMSQARFFSRSNETGLYQRGGHISYNNHRRLTINGELFTFCIEKGQKHNVSWEDLRYVTTGLYADVVQGEPWNLPDEPLSRFIPSGVPSADTPSPSTDS